MVLALDVQAIAADIDQTARKIEFGLYFQRKLLLD
jgi:hypothetical protein